MCSCGRSERVNRGCAMGFGASRARRRRPVAVAAVCSVLLGLTVVADGVGSRASAATTPIVNVGDVAVNEGDLGVAKVVVPVELSRTAGAVVTVKWALVGG